MVGARNPDQALELQTAIPKDRLMILPLNLASLASVRRFAAATIAQLGDRQHSHREDWQQALYELSIRLGEA